MSDGSRSGAAEFGKGVVGLMNRGPSATETVDVLPKTPTMCRQWVRCGKPGCRCAEGYPHGPYHYLFWREGGRLRKRYVRAADVAAVMVACAARRDRERRWRRLVRADRQTWRILAARLREAEQRE